MSRPEPGQVLAGRFRISGAALGAGATGVVLPAVDQHTGREVAVKVLHEHLLGDAATLERLEVEAGIATRLQHPHILPARGLWSDEGGGRLLVTELVRDARSVESLDAPLDPSSVVELGLHLAGALEAAHGRGLVHGDVRPGNVLLSARGALLFDFGISSWAGLGQDGAAGRPGETAPEVHQGAPPTPMADLYGLGIVLYRALAGELPFDGPTPWAVVGSQEQGAPPQPPGPEGLSRLVTDLLHPDPVQRPADAGAVRRALQRVRARPERPVRVGRRWLAPIRPGRAWVVHGIDPATGAHSLVRADLGRQGAARLARHLREEGWAVHTAREALGWLDLAWVGLLALVGALVVPVVGAVLGIGLGLLWRGRGCEPRLREVLPAARAQLPPRQAETGTEAMVAVGILLLATAVLLVLFPPAALVSLSLAVVVAWRALYGRRAEVGAVAAQARSQDALLEARSHVERCVLDLDRQLLLLGELQEIEAEYQASQLDDDALLLRVEAVVERAGERSVSQPTDDVAAVLRRARDESGDPA